VATSEHPPEAVWTAGPGWRVEIVEEPVGAEAHVVPAEQDHRLSLSCWCLPALAESELLASRVWLHRRTHDHPHRYRDDEG